MAKAKGTAAHGGTPFVFTAEDLDILVQTLDIVPDLRICAWVLKTARDAKTKYPLKSAVVLTRLLPLKALRKMGNDLIAGHITRCLSDDLFPIADEGELCQRTYIALARCREDISRASHASPHAPGLIRSLTRWTAAGRGTP